MEKETIGLNYEAEYKRLQEKLNYEMKVNEEKWQGIANTQQKEIDWLKSVINGILHI